MLASNLKISSNTAISLICVYLLQVFIGTVCFGALVRFHLKLLYINMSTFDYFNYKREKKWDPNYKDRPEIPQKFSKVKRSARFGC